MRAPFAFFVAFLTTGCGSVPDLHFDDGSDGGSSTTLLDASLPSTGQDASVGGSDAAPPGTGDDATTVTPGDDASGDSGNTPPPPDANPPPPDAGSNDDNTCPGKTPSGAQCCIGTSIECRPASTFSICDCITCDKQCNGPQTVCCMDKNGKFESCVNSLGDCPKL